MKTLSIFLLLWTFLFAGCNTSNDDIPVIEVVKLCVNDDDTNYYNKLDELPVLTIGDELTIELNLRGSKLDLSHFAVQEGKEEILQNNEPDTKLFSFVLDFNENEISNTISSPEEGTLAFKDGVHRASLRVTATVMNIAEGTVSILFYLSSKGHTEANKMEINLTLANNAVPTTKLKESI